MPILAHECLKHYPVHNITLTSLTTLVCMDTLMYSQ